MPFWTARFGDVTMGVGNRDRRRTIRPGGGWGGDLRDEHFVRSAVLAAAEALRLEPEPVARSRLDVLLALESRVGRAAIDRAVDWWVDQGLDRAWTSGWQPADVVRTVRRMVGPPQADALAPAVARSAARRPEHAIDDRWAAQVAALTGHPVATASRLLWSHLDGGLEVVSLLLDLPALPHLASPGRAEGRRGSSGAMLERVRALLAKAESTTFPEEAEALAAKAQELMSRYAIDQAMLDARSATGVADVVGWRVGVDDPYAAAKSLLLDRIAAANRCRALWSKPFGFSTVFGARSDLEMVELLFTSLLVQAGEAMVRAGGSVDGAGRSRKRSFRQSFLLAYAIRIGERLEATSAQVVEEETARRGDALLPVLASRAEAVDEAVQAVYPRVAEREMAVKNYSGWVAGRAAAELASMVVSDALPGG